MPAKPAKNGKPSRPRPGAPQRILETDLYEPLRNLLQHCGYKVRGEVLSCDLVAVKDKQIVVIEQKLRLNLELLAQAAQRQKITESVYVAVPVEEVQRWGRRWRSVRHVCQRLELGLILVDLKKKPPQAHVEFHPVTAPRRKKHDLVRAVLQEVEMRSVDGNKGGASRVPLLTAYRENCIHIAVCLDLYGPLSPKALRELGTGAKTLSILSNNFHGWFDRIGHGLYSLRPEGHAALASYQELVHFWRSQHTGGDPSHE